MFNMEYAAIIKAVAAATGYTDIQYDDLPEGFAKPCLYFPHPEIDTGGHTLTAYRTDSTAFALIFCDKTQDAMAAGYQYIRAAKKARNRVQEIDIDGVDVAGKVFRMGDPKLSAIDIGVAQLILSWRSVYMFDVPAAEMVNSIVLNITHKGG